MFLATIAIVALVGLVLGFLAGLWFFANEEKLVYMNSSLCVSEFEYLCSFERHVIEEQHPERLKVFLNYYQGKPWWQPVKPLEVHRRFKSAGLWSPWDNYDYKQAVLDMAQCRSI